MLRRWALELEKMPARERLSGMISTPWRLRDDADEISIIPLPANPAALPQEAPQ